MRDGIDDESYGQIFKPVSFFKALWKNTYFIFVDLFSEYELTSLCFILIIDYIQSNGDVSAQCCGITVRSRFIVW